MCREARKVCSSSTQKTRKKKHLLLVSPQENTKLSLWYVLDLPRANCSVQLLPLSLVDKPGTLLPIPWPITDWQRNDILSSCKQCVESLDHCDIAQHYSKQKLERRAPCRFHVPFEVMNCCILAPALLLETRGGGLHCVGLDEQETISSAPAASSSKKMNNGAPCWTSSQCFFCYDNGKHNETLGTMGWWSRSVH